MMPTRGVGEVSIYKQIVCKCKNVKLATNKNGRFKECYNISLIKLEKALKSTGVSYIEISHSRKKY